MNLVFLCACVEQIIQTSNLLFPGQAPFVTLRFLCRADTPLADLLPLLTFSAKRDRIYDHRGTVCNVYSGHIEQVFPVILIGC